MNFEGSSAGGTGASLWGFQRQEADGKRATDGLERPQNDDPVPPVIRFHTRKKNLTNSCPTLQLQILSDSQLITPLGKFQLFQY